MTGRRPKQSASGGAGGGARRDLHRALFWAGIALLMLLAFVLRWWHVDFGLPMRYHPDEGGKAGVVERILNLERPDYLNHPGMLVNSVAATAALLRATGHPLDGRNDLLLIGRKVDVVVGVLTLLPLALLGSLLFDRRTGLLAAAILAVAPSHVIHSQFFKEDIYLTFWLLVTQIGVVGWLRASGEGRPARGWLALALAGGGLAMGSKYVGVLAGAMVIFIWKRRRGVRWRATWPLWLVVLAAFLVTTPQLFNLNAIKDGLWYELRHGVEGSGAPKLFFVEWPDLGTYFFFHGLGTGLSWPLTLLGCWGLWLGWRRRHADPAIGWTVGATLLWYAIAELTPLKRSAGVERYVLPCVPLVGLFAAALILRWRPAQLGRLRVPRAAWLAAPLLLALPLAHSFALVRASADDTREQAARWLAAHGPTPPYVIASLGDDCYQLDIALVPGASMQDVSYDLKKEDDRAAFEQAAVFTTTELEINRYVNFSTFRKGKVRDLERLRKQFPYGVWFRRPWYEKMSFHNPDIEVRLRQAPDAKDQKDP